MEVTQQFLHRYYRVSAEALPSVCNTIQRLHLVPVEKVVEKPVEN